MVIWRIWESTVGFYRGLTVYKGPSVLVDVNSWWPDVVLFLQNSLRSVLTLLLYSSDYEFTLFGDGSGKPGIEGIEKWGTEQYKFPPFILALSILFIAGVSYLTLHTEPYCIHSYHPCTSWVTFSPVRNLFITLLNVNTTIRKYNLRI